MSIKEEEKRLEAIVRAALSDVQDSVLDDLGPAFHNFMFFGIIGYDPAALKVWYFFTTDDDLRKAKNSGVAVRLIDETRTALRKNGYPKKVIPAILISFASYEDVERTAGGDYYKYLK